MEKLKVLLRSMLSTATIPSLAEAILKRIEF
jgi:hypothetical protein